MSAEIPGRRRVLGIDPGTRVVGYGVLDIAGPGRFAYVECGVLSVPAADGVPRRIHRLGAQLVELLEELRPTDVAIEAAFHGQNASSALKLAESRGAYREICMQRGLEPHEYPPARVKRAVRGDGRADKAAIAERVAMLFGLSRPPKSDAADALAIALCHAQQLTGPATVGRFRR